MNTPVHTPVHTPENTPVNPFFFWRGQLETTRTISLHGGAGSTQPKRVSPTTSFVEGVGTVHASRGKTIQKRLCKVFGCCTTQHALPTAEPRRTNTCSLGNGSITGFGRSEAAKERGLFGLYRFLCTASGPFFALWTVPSLQMEAVPERAVPLLRTGRPCHRLPLPICVHRATRPPASRAATFSKPCCPACCTAVAKDVEGTATPAGTGRPEAAEEQNVQALEVTNLNSRDSFASPRADHNGVALEARWRKERIYPELSGDEGRVRMVIGCSWRQVEHRDGQSWSVRGQASSHGPHVHCFVVGPLSSRAVARFF